MELVHDRTDTIAALLTAKISGVRPMDCCERRSNEAVPRPKYEKLSLPKPVTSLGRSYAICLPLS